MSWYHPATLLDKVFETGLVLKGISGAVELITGSVLFFVSPSSIHRFITFLTQSTLQEDPHDKVATLLVHSTQHIGQNGKGFLVAYLWIHAFIKLIAVIGILKNLLWAYPFSLITLGLLMLYQIYTIIIHATVGLVLLTIFDVLILWLIWREYGQAKLAAAVKL
jgi:uncharacterized membrane protein